MGGDRTLGHKDFTLRTLPRSALTLGLDTTPVSHTAPGRHSVSVNLPVTGPTTVGSSGRRPRYAREMGPESLRREVRTWGRYPTQDSPGTWTVPTSTETSGVPRSRGVHCRPRRSRPRPWPVRVRETRVTGVGTDESPGPKLGS